MATTMKDMPQPNDAGPVADYISAEHLNKAFMRGDEEFVAVNDVTLTIGKGDFLTVVGPSGCGKSTLLQMIAGLLAPTRGRVMFEGSAVEGPPFDMVYVFQQYTKSLMPWRTVLDNVALGLEVAQRKQGRSRAQLRDRCRSELARVGLAGTEDQYPWQLSGGMQQRVAIARALVCEPSVLLMDEPFSALDALSRSSLQDLLLDLWAQLHLTVVFVTHDVEEAVYLSDRVAVLSKSPSCIVERFDIDLPRPRHQITTKESSAFLEYRRDLYAKVLAE